MPSPGRCPGSCAAPGLPGWVLTLQPGCSPSSPAAWAAAARVAPRKVLPAQGSSFPAFAVEVVKNKLRKPLASVSPSPQAAGQQCPRVLPAQPLAGPDCLAPAPQHPSTPVPWPLFHLASPSLAVRHSKGSIPGAGQGRPFPRTHQSCSPDCHGAGSVPVQHPSTLPGAEAPTSPKEGPRNQHLSELGGAPTLPKTPQSQDAASPGAGGDRGAVADEAASHEPARPPVL